jgi:glycerol-3-phosphate O-acyltransferase
MDDKTVNAKIKEIIIDKAFQKILSSISVEKGISLVQANIEAEMYFQELYAEHDPTVNVGFIEVFQHLIGKGFEKHIDSDPTELKALSKLMRKHPVAFVLTHKSTITFYVCGY